MIVRGHYSSDNLQANEQLHRLTFYCGRHLASSTATEDFKLEFGDDRG